MTTEAIEFFLKKYLADRPLFLSLIRAKEAALFQKYLPFKKPVLDVGCGDGFFAKTILSMKYQKLNSNNQTSSKIQNPNTNSIEGIDVGLDLSTSRMGEARELGVYNKIVTFDGVHIPFPDRKAIPIPDRKFATVISNCVLEHVERLPELLTEIHRVLAPGGVFITTVMAKPWEENLVGTMFLGNTYKMYLRRKQAHLNLFTRDEWRSAFIKGRFRVIGEIGYLSPAACRLIDVCHYLSIPNLMSYTLFGKWVLTPGFPPYPLAWLSNVVSEPVEPDLSGALFYVLEKHSKAIDKK